MSERRIVLRTDDDSTIEIRWEPGAKFVIEVAESPVKTEWPSSPVARELREDAVYAPPSAADSSAGTAKREAVSPESPASTAHAEGSAALEQRRASSGEGIEP